MPVLRRLSFRPSARLLAALLVPAALASAPLAAQQVYKWKDANGVTHFTAEPPPEGARYESREVSRREAVPATPVADDAAQQPAAARREDPACATARENLALLRGNAQVMVDSDGDGTPDKPLAEADRQKQRNLAEAVIAARCSGNAGAQAEPEEAEGE